MNRYPKEAAMKNYKRYMTILLFMIAALLVGSSVGYSQMDGRVLLLQGPGQGTVVSQSPPADFPQVDVAFSGSGMLTHIGAVTWEATLSMNYGDAIPLANGNLCVVASGSVVETIASGDTLTSEIVGPFCEVGDDGTPYYPDPPFTFNGTFYFSEGTGTLEGVKGSGNISGSVDANGKVIVSKHGTILR